MDPKTARRRSDWGRDDAVIASVFALIVTGFLHSVWNVVTALYW